MWLFRKNKELLAKLDEYMKTAVNSLAVFEETITHYMAHGIDEHFNVLVKKTHQQESLADDIRRSIELEMYQKSLLPETREDLLNIIETMDKIPNLAEAVCYDFVIQKTVLCKDIREKFMELLKLSRETFDRTVEATRDCFDKREKISEYKVVVDKNESIGDSLERDMITIIFNSNLETGEKVIQRDIVIKLGEICDQCERVLDKIVICSVKRCM